MKIKKNSFIFSNFNKPLSNTISTNELIPCKYTNIDLNQNYILCANGFDDFLAKILSKEDYDYLKLYYENVLNKIIDVQIYEFFDEVSGVSKIRIFFIDTNFNLIEYSNKLFVNLTDINFKNKPNVIIHNNIIHFYDDDILCYIDGNSTPIISTTSCNISTYAQSKNILYFAISNDKQNIYIAPNETLTNLYHDTTLYIKISINKDYGELLKIINIKHKVYVFQKYGISYIDSSSDYELIDVCNMNCKILSNTISLNESYVYFSTTNGIYIFDGSDVKKIHNNLTNILILDDDNIGLSYNNNYFLKTKLKEDGADVIIKTHTDNSPVIYDIGKLSNMYLIKTNSFYNLVTITSDYKFLCYSNKTNINKKYIKFNKLVFNTHLLKHITSIKILCAGKFEIKISSETSCKDYLIENNTIITNIDIPGYVYEIEIVTNEFFKLECIIFDINIIEDIND